MPRTEARCCQRAARTFHSQLSLIKTARTQGTNCMWRLGKGTHGTSYSEASLISDTKTAPSRHWYDGPISQLGARHGLAVHSALCCNYVPSLAVPAYLLSVVDPVVLVGRRNWVASGRGRGVARTWSVRSRRIVAAPCLLLSTFQWRKLARTPGYRHTVGCPNQRLWPIAGCNRETASAAVVKVVSQR